MTAGSEPVRESDAFAMTGPRLFLGFTLVVLAATLTLLWQAFGPRPVPPSQSVAAAPAVPAARPAAPVSEEPAVRSVYPGLRPGAARPPEATVETSPAPALAAPTSESTSKTASPPSPETQSAALQPPAPPPPVPAPALPPNPSPEAAEAPAGEAVDLNTASVEQLNELGAGMIGRHIAANRPYASPDELLSKRILNRRDFETIRPRVVAR